MSPPYLGRPGWVALVAQLSRNGRRGCPIAGETISFYRADGRGGRLVGSAVTGRSGFAVTTSYVRRTTSFYAVGGNAGSGVVTVTVGER